MVIALAINSVAAPTIEPTAAAHEIAPEGVDAVLGLAGGEPLERCVDTMHSGGRVAYPNGVEPEPKKRRGICAIPYDGVPGIRQFDRLGRAVEAAKPQIPSQQGIGSAMLRRPTSI